VVISSFPEAQHRARLLVVDDESNLRAALRDVLSLMGYYVDVSASGDEALQSLEESSYDLMVLDMHMPGMHGVEVMKRVRQDYPDVSIIVLTAHASVESAIAAVKSGVDDYMLKPFDIGELAETITRTLREREKTLRRKKLLNLIGGALDKLDSVQDIGPTGDAESNDGQSTAIQRFVHAGCLTLDRQKRIVVVRGRSPSSVELTEGETTVLAALMAQPNQVLSWVELLQDSSLCQMSKQEVQNQARLYIFRLRRKIESDPSDPDLIRTVRGRGYFLSVR